MAMAKPLKTEEPKALRWTREEYYRMAKLGFFNGRRVELIEGEVLEMTPPLPPHSVAITLVDEVMNGIFGKGYTVRTENPLSLGLSSDPQPDVAVVVGEPRDYLKHHPTSAVLVIEVADTTLSYDRGRKARLYAEAGIEDYWILNLVERQLEVYRKPQKKPRQRRASYTEVTIYSEKDTVSPLAAPHAVIKVADLLP